MPAGIVQVMNNTSHTLHYHNLESGHKINLKPKTQLSENNNWIPSSNFYDDRIPWKQSNHINVWLDDGPKVEISDDNWRFGIVGPVAYTDKIVEEGYGSLSLGGRYILRLDEVTDGTTRNCGFTILKYENKYLVTGDRIASQLIQQATPVVALVLMAILVTRLDPRSAVPECPFQGVPDCRHKSFGPSFTVIR